MPRMKENCFNSDLAAEAGKRALDMAGVDKRYVDMLIHSTCTPDYLTPATSTFIQEKIGLENDI